MDDCVVLVTEERLGQMHLHLLSSYCAWNQFAVVRKARFPSGSNDSSRERVLTSDRCDRQAITIIAAGKMYFNIFSSGKENGEHRLRRCAITRDGDQLRTRYLSEA